MAIKFKGFDFVEFDSLLSEEELMVRDTARQFIEDNLIPIIEECNREGRFPRELVQAHGGTRASSAPLSRAMAAPE